MIEIAAAMGAGILGGILFLMADLLFGGNRDSAYTASLYGFWILAAVGWLANRPEGRPAPAGIGIAGPAPGTRGQGVRFEEEAAVDPVPAVRLQPLAPAQSRPPGPDAVEGLPVTHAVGEIGVGGPLAASLADHILELEAEAIFRAAYLGHLDRALELRRRNRRRPADYRGRIEPLDLMIRERFAYDLADARIAGDETTVTKLKRAYADLMVMDQG